MWLVRIQPLQGTVLNGQRPAVVGEVHGRGPVDFAQEPQGRSGEPTQPVSAPRRGLFTQRDADAGHAGVAGYVGQATRNDRLRRSRKPLFWTCRVTETIYSSFATNRFSH